MLVAEVSNWSECSVRCGGGGVQRRFSQSSGWEEQECGARACPEVGQWGEWSECSRTCGDGFT